jgi:hypothetical protein
MAARPRDAQPIVAILEASTPEQPVDDAEVRRLSAIGLDSYSAEDRCLAWLVMLGIYPKCAAEWPSTMLRLNTEYWELVQYSGVSHWHTKVVPVHFPSEEYGLPKNEIMGIIHGDIVRTGRLAFFLPPLPIPGTEPSSDEDVLHDIQEHIRRLERVLYVFSTLHVGLSYMQGFNELVTPFYYVLLKCLGTLFRNEINFVESLTFHLFQELLTKTELAEFYTTQDKSSFILHRVGQFEDLLARHLPVAAGIIKSLRIHPLFYCLRWFTLLFAQEHDLPTLLAIWDSLFAHFAKFVDYLYCMAIGQIHEIERKLDKANYAQTIQALQNLEIGSDIKEVLIFANQCWDSDHKPQKSSFVAKLADLGRKFGW